MKNDTSTEDKHETNHINNKYNDMNMDTQDAQHLNLVTLLMSCHMHLVAQVLSPVMSSMYMCVSLEFTSLILYFDLSFTILSLFFPLMHFEEHTELDNLIAMQNLRTSANKGSNDAYDVSVSLTERAIRSQRNAHTLPFLVSNLRQSERKGRAKRKEGKRRTEMQEEKRGFVRPQFHSNPKLLDKWKIVMTRRQPLCTNTITPK